MDINNGSNIGYAWLVEKLVTLFSATPAEKVILFGSWAKGTNTARSDIDLIVVCRTERDFFRRYLDFMEVYRALDNFEIDLLVYTPQELERMQERFFMQSAMKEGKLIYERGKKAA